MSLLLLILLCAALGGIASAAFAVVFLWVPEARAARILPHFVSFATGALLGAALLGLLPEAVEGAGYAGAHRIGVALLLGLGFFFIVEKLVLWWHSHEAHGPAAGPDSHGHLHASGVLVLVGDSIHNALDGILIAAAFLKDPTLGFVTTFAVAAHEVPHRVGDFALLVHAGLSRERALVLNLATGLASLAGAALTFFALREATGALPYALAFAAAGFLYIALAGLVPSLQRSIGVGRGLAQLALLVLGVAAVGFAEHLAHR